MDTIIDLHEWRALALESPGGDPGWYCAECAYAAEGHAYLHRGTVEDLALFLDGEPVVCDGGCGTELLTGAEGAAAWAQRPRPWMGRRGWPGREALDLPEPGFWVRIKRLFFRPLGDDGGTVK